MPILFSHSQTAASPKSIIGGRWKQLLSPSQIGSFAPIAIDNFSKSSSLTGKGSRSRGSTCSRKLWVVWTVFSANSFPSASLSWAGMGTWLDDTDSIWGLDKRDADDLRWEELELWPRYGFDSERWAAGAAERQGTMGQGRVMQNFVEPRWRHAGEKSRGWTAWHPSRGNHDS